ncbi:hypothetical protein [Jannaschia pohangensis]|uniref:Uncharacterized protein n=1 Tax=Jannaschia pohangensis TaxID=390807 RepID=A0A1I3S7Y7_9RHOB|nr:hypothetical protein [Jannaschia pohangensis]SFJ54924.1 hypothetical protein SAMN04488095_3055 [Jannaschia pohangensis]
MQYAAFRDAATETMTDTYRRDVNDGLSFPPSETELFQTIRSDPTAWQPNLEALLRDPEVDFFTKYGAAATMLDLPAGRRADILTLLLDEAERDPAMMEIALAFAYGSWRGGSFVRSSLLADSAPIDDGLDPRVRPVLRRLYDHPLLPADQRGPDWPLGEIFGG